MAYQEYAGSARPDQEDEKLRCTLNLLVEREGQRRTAEILGVDRKTVALALQRDGLTPRMRDAIERVMLRMENPERELGETSPDIVSEALRTLNSTVDDLVDEVKGLARRVEALEQGQSDSDQVSVAIAVMLDQGQDHPGPSPKVVENRHVSSLPEVRSFPWWRRLVRALGAGQ